MVHVTVNPPPPPPKTKEEPPKEATGGSAEVDAIKDLVHVRFKEAYEGMVLEELKSVWPSLTKNQFNLISNSFKGLKSLRLTDECAGSPNIAGNDAEWSCEETVSYVVGTKRDFLKPSRITFHLRKINGKWYVDSRRVM